MSSLLNKQGGDELLKLIKSTAPKVERTERILFLYYTIPAISEIWSKEQIDELLAMIDDNNTRNLIVKALDRQKK